MLFLIIDAIINIVVFENRHSNSGIVVELYHALNRLLRYKTHARISISAVLSKKNIFTKNKV